MTATGTDTATAQVHGAPPARGRKARYARWVALGCGVVFLGFAVVLATQVGSDPSYQGGKVIDRPAPDIDLPTLAGGRITSADLRGKAVVVNFWNSWCIPCQKELPALKAFAAQHAADDDVVLLGIVRDDTEAAIRSYVTEQGIAWPVAFDPDAKAAIDFGTTGQPETYAISKDGVVVAQQFGEVSVANLDAMLACAREGLCA
jgi:cytochrome c biogenesis protein CcmG/thiol:disulfide interchange protein DsbE